MTQKNATSNITMSPINRIIFNLFADSTEKVIKDSQIIINGETTILITPEGEKTICRPTTRELYNRETGIAMCIVKYLFGSRRKFMKFVESAKDQTPDHWSRND